MSVATDIATLKNQVATLKNQMANVKTVVDRHTQEITDLFQEANNHRGIIQAVDRVAAAIKLAGGMTAAQETQVKAALDDLNTTASKPD